MTDLSSLKISHYAAAYNEELSRIEVNALLEIGIAAGGSLQKWRRTYPTAYVIGVDKDARCDKLKFCEPGIPVLIGDISDNNFAEQKILSFPFLFDVIIDDGSHWPHHQRAAFKYLWPKLADGGVYVIEDLCTSYAPFWRHRNWRGNIQRFLRSLVAQMNNYWDHPGLGEYTGSIAKIVHYDSIVFIHKGKNIKHYEVITPGDDCRL